MSWLLIAGELVAGAGAGPFGGYKQSGLGSELGREGLEAFQEPKHVHLDTVIERKDWWYPYGPGDAASEPS